MRAASISKNYREEYSMFQPDLMLRTLRPQDITAARQREVDERLGKDVAAVVRRTRRFAARARAVSTTLNRPARRRARTTPSRTP
jgi:hypothetical protein